MIHMVRFARRIYRTGINLKIRNINLSQFRRAPMSSPVLLERRDFQRKWFHRNQKPWWRVKIREPGEDRKIRRGFQHGLSFHRCSTVHIEQLRLRHIRSAVQVLFPNTAVKSRLSHQKHTETLVCIHERVGCFKLLGTQRNLNSARTRSNDLSETHRKHTIAVKCFKFVHRWASRRSQLIMLIWKAVFSTSTIRLARLPTI